MRKFIAIFLLLAVFSIAETLPDAPSASQSKTQFSDVLVGDSCIACTESAAPDASRALFSRPSFAERHRKAIIWGGLGVGAIAGTIFGLLKHSGHCPSRIFYEGKWYPYSGSYDDQHHCPTEPPGIEPGK